MASAISQIIRFLKSLPSDFPDSRFNYNRNRMGMSACSLRGRMTHVSTRSDPHIFSPFDADDLSRCLWWIIDHPDYWKEENFLSIAMATPAWQGIVLWLIPLIQELMLTSTREEPDLSKWIRQIMNDSIDPPPHQNMEEAIELVADLISQHNDARELNPALICSKLTINLHKVRADEARSDEDEDEDGNLLVRRQQYVWKDFQSSPPKLTNDLNTICSKNKGKFRIVVARPGEVRVLLEQTNRWSTKITDTPASTSVMYYGDAE